MQELGDTVTGEEMGIWQAEYERQPWGEIRIDLAGGVVASVLANVHRGKDSQPYKPSDFMPLSAPPAPPEPAPDPVSFFNALGG